MMSGVMKPFPSEGFPLPSNFCTPPCPCSVGAVEAAAIPANPKLGRSAASFAAKPRRVVRLENIFLSSFFNQHESKLASLRQSKTKNVASRGDGDILFAIHRVGHRRSAQRLPGVKVPQRLAGVCINRFER